MTSSKRWDFWNDPDRWGVDPYHPRDPFWIREREDLIRAKVKKIFLHTFKTIAEHKKAKREK